MLRNHETERPFMGPRFLVRAAGLEMHPIDQADRPRYLKDDGGIGYCNITKCCTEVCPEHIKITDNAIIPLKERVADEYYDPIQLVWRKLRQRAEVTPSSRSSKADEVRARRHDARPGRRRSGRRALAAPSTGRPRTLPASSSAPMARPAATPAPPRPARC